MPLQVGLSCYATPVDAGQAACASFQPVTTVTASSVRTVTCSSADAASGALNLSVATTDTTTNVTTTQLISQLETYPPCSHGDYLVAFEVIFSGILGILTMIWCYKKLLDFLGWSRGENA